MSKWWRFDGILQKAGWLSPAFIQTNADGLIQKIADSPPQEPQENVTGYAIPGFTNCHSHAFQYAMAGLAEHLGNAGHALDDFWSWREAMYDLALKISPEAMEAVATQLYAEMLTRGYTAVVEFHYMHNNEQGQRYTNSAEMAERLIIAALRTGIHLILVPVYYNQGDFGMSISPRQKRFLSHDPDDFFCLLADTENSIKRATANLPRKIHFGFGVHSLRATTENDFKTIVAHKKPGTSFHLHIAEQAKEVNACYQYLKKRPVEWLLENIPLDQDFSLVHATHMNNTETACLAKTNATVVLCPSTEGNLGDGFFPFASYVKSGGHWTIGTDSHIGLCPVEELRWLDYGQRLRNQKRNTLCFAPEEDSGEKLLQESITRGFTSSGRARTDYFSVGAPLDAVVFNSPLIAATPPKRLLATILFASDARAVQQVIVQGKTLVTKAGHIQQEKIRQEFIQAMQSLGTRY